MAKKIGNLIIFMIRINKYIKRHMSHLYYSIIINKLGDKSYIISPLRIDGPSNIDIGKNVFIEYKTWLAALPLTAEKSCCLKIGNHCSIGHFNHIYCTKSIVIEDYVLTADKVYISDNLHGYEDISLPILKQPIIQNNTVTIGEGSWLGEHVCVMGANIGKHCVIGANSVVTKDIPAYSIAVGSPARVIKRYDFERNAWLETDLKGNFID